MSKASLEELLKAVDTAVWAWAVKNNSKRRGMVNWKGAFDDLSKAYENHLKCDDATTYVLSAEMMEAAHKHAGEK